MADVWKLRRLRGYHREAPPLERLELARVDHESAIADGRPAEEIRRARDRWTGIYRNIVSTGNLVVLKKLFATKAPAIKFRKKLERRIVQLEASERKNQEVIV